MLERGAVTQILEELAAGDRSAGDRLLPLVYGELRALAGSIFSGERAGHTLQPTVLVHEAYLRIVGAASPLQTTGRAHFLALAARVMRQLLVDHARVKRAAKRNPGPASGALQGALDATPGADAIPASDLLDLDAALTELAAEYPRAAHVVELRFFGGLMMEEIAGLVGVNRATADRDWALARGWLSRRLRGTGGP